MKHANHAHRSLGNTYLQELMSKVLKDLPFAITYLGDIIFYSKTAHDHLNHVKQVFHKIQKTKLSMKLSQCHFFAKEIQYSGHILSARGIKHLPSKTKANRVMWPSGTPTMYVLSLVLCITTKYLLKILLI